MTTIKHRRGTAAEWAAANPVLAAGEPGYETDTGQEKRGDGILPYDELSPFLNDADNTAKFSQVLHRPVNVAEAFGRTDTDVRAAIAEAESTSRAAYFQGGAFTLAGNLAFTDPIDLTGDGVTSRLNITDGGVLFDGTAGFLLRPTLKDIRIARIGTVAGPALHFKGAGNATGVARWVANNVHCSSTLGEACLIEGSYLGTFIGCNFESSVYGIRGKLETTTNVVALNAVTFVGGESNGNQTGWDFERPSGVSFYGFTTEGNTVRGGKLQGVVRGFVYHGGYFELNTGPDIEIDPLAGSGGILIEGNVFYTTGAVKTESILLKRGRVGINNNIFHGLVEGAGDVAIRVSEGTSPVSGEARNNMRDDNGTIVAYTVGGNAFNVTQLGKITKAPNTVTSSVLTEEYGVAWTRQVSAALDFPSMAAGTEAILTVSVPGAVTTDMCSVSSSMLETGLSISAWGVTAADTVSIRLRNNTAGTIDPSARTYRVRVWR